MTSMEDFIRYENLIIFKRRLADPDITEKQRRLLTKLLARVQSPSGHQEEDLPQDR
ncbi:hypothetical protein ACVWZ4_001798 [Bradyrhizobium sp. USDA 4472]